MFEVERFYNAVILGLVFITIKKEASASFVFIYNPNKIRRIVAFDTNRPV